MTRKTSLSCSSLLLAAGLSVACLTGTSMGETPRADKPTVQLDRAFWDRWANDVVDDGPNNPGESNSDRAITCQPSWQATLPPSPNANCISLYGTPAAANNVPSDTEAFIDLGTQQFETLNLATAENFVVSASGNIDGICFWGRYRDDSGTPNVAVGPPPTTVQTFRIRYYSDGGGFPCGLPLAEYTVGALAPTPGTTLNRVGGTAGVTGPTATYFRYTVTHPNFAVTAGACMWVEVVDVAPGITYFNWVGQGLENGASNDNLSANRLDRDFYVATDIAAPDLTLCVSLNLAPITCSVPTAVPANDAIGSPEALTIGALPVVRNNINATADVGPACGGLAVDADGVWFSVTGNGNSLTVSTDGALCQDTQVIVFDATAFSGSGVPSDLICVDGNDDRAPGDLDSEVTWCSGSGTPYLIFVAGLNPIVVGDTFLVANGQSESYFPIAITAGASCSPATSNPCSVVQAVTDVVESETCGSDANTGCALAQQINVGDTIFGTFFAGSPTVFDQDIDDYAFTLAAAQDIDFTIESESAALIAIVDCTANALVDAIGIAECVPGPHLRLSLPAGSYSVEVFTFSFGGTPCGSGWESYRLSVVPTPTGACCVGTTCSVTTPTVCNDQNGTWDGNTADCSSTPCAANCVLTLGAPAEAEACLTDPTLSSNSAADCSTANALTLGTTSYGTLSTGDGAPAPGTRDIDLWAVTLASASDLEITVEAQSDTIVQLLNCPAGTVVDGFLVDSCTTTANTAAAVPAGSYAVLVTTADFFGSPCGGGTNNYSVKAALPTPACPPQFETADFDNNGSVSVNDLFAFLAAWFAQNGQVGMGLSADVDGNNSVTVNDLFFFLAAWFAQNGVTCP